VSIKEYLGFVTDEVKANWMYKKLVGNDGIRTTTSESPYVFLPDFSDPLPKPFSEVDQEISFQEGSLIKQWTIKLQRTTKAGKEFALMKIRYAPLFNELIEFQVELGPVPLDDNRSKDIIVNWKMYDDFDPKDVFWTDSNGMEMQKR
jgi:hypothetical protein